MHITSLSSERKVIRYIYMSNTPKATDDSGADRPLDMTAVGLSYHHFCGYDVAVCLNDDWIYTARRLG